MRQLRAKAHPNLAGLKQFQAFADLAENRFADALQKLERDLDAKQRSLEMTGKELEAREAKVQELQDILSKKEAAVNALKKKVSDALLNFQGKGVRPFKR